MKSGPAPKTEGRQRRNKPNTVQLDPSRDLQLPELPQHWTPEVLQEWQLFWASDVAAAVSQSDIPSLIRLFDLRAMEQDYREQAQKEPLVTGSKGQPVQNPLLKVADTFRAEIRQLEDRYGLNPAARAKLGIDNSKLQTSLLDLNSRIAEAANEPDPRLVLQSSEAD